MNLIKLITSTASSNAVSMKAEYKALSMSFALLSSVAVAIRSVSGIEWLSPNKSVFFSPNFFTKTSEQSSLKASIEANKKSAFCKTKVFESVAMSNVEPM